MTMDPAGLKSVAVTAEDLLAAVEANAGGDTRTVLRVTPPYSGRMRARLHVVQDDADDDTMHIPPAAFLDESAPSYPTADATADELREDGDATYSVERHREYHERRLGEWRDRLLDHVAETVHVGGADHEVTVSLLGP